MSPSIDRRNLLIRAAGAAATGAAAGLVGWDTAYAAKAPFVHGVASGDPLPQAVVIWTRVTPNAQAQPGSGRGPAVDVRWEIATDKVFRNVVARGRSRATSRHDHTVHVDVTGLRPATTYWYRFRARGARSPIGRTRTAPAVNADTAVRLGVVSCANYDWGFFGAYRHLANQNVDAVLHLGDYLYEYGPDGPLGEGLPSPVAPRHADPPRECTTITDYRVRHGCYRLDPDLQAMHARHPVIAVWDDHEIANDTWKRGAENHDPGEHSWKSRSRGGRRAWLEWLPVRRVAGQSRFRIHRRIRYGRHVELWMLDERRFRDQQPDSAAFSAGSVDPTRNDPDRTMLGERQADWLSKGLERSKATWKVIGNQVPFFPTVLGPAYPAAVTAVLEPISPALAHEPAAYYVDDWNGYPAERRRLVSTISKIKDVVILTGDVHQSYACEIPHDPGMYGVTGESVAVELITPGISSPSIATIAAQFLPGANAAFNAVVGSNERVFNPWVKFSENSRCGYLIVDINARRVRADWWLADDAQSRSTAVRRAHTARVRRGSSQVG
ncbi:alkaline phosphatase D family protein [Nocardioides salsibiostraticola]